MTTKASEFEAPENQASADQRSTPEASVGPGRSVEPDLSLAGVIRGCLSRRFILRSERQKLFLAIVEQRGALGEYFSRMGARLVVDEGLGIAYLQSMTEHDEYIEYRLGRTKRLSPLETLLLFLLRWYRKNYFLEEADMEMPVISVERIREMLEEYKPEREGRTFEQKLKRAIENLGDLKILLKTDHPERFAVSPVADVLLTADRIERSLNRARDYFASGAKDGAEADGTSSDDDDPDPDASTDSDH
ncbi:MAG: DUF4194 domain-containing protein [Leptospirales bacterium]|jgi:hypothetical protein